MCGKELPLVQENYAAVKLNSSVYSRWMKTYSESRIELRNPQFLKKLLERSSQFWSSEQPSEPKSLDVAFNIAGVEKIRSENSRLETLEAIRVEFWTERSVSDGGNLSPLQFVILKSVWNSVGDIF